MDTRTRLIVTSVMFLTAIIAYLIYRIIKKKHSNDPVFLEEQRLRQEAYREKIEEENRELAEYDLRDYDYRDFDESEGNEENQPG